MALFTSAMIGLSTLAFAGPARAAAVNLLPSTADQAAVTLPITGFAPTDVLLVNVSLQGAPTGTTFRFATTTGLTPAYGYSFGSTMQDIGFTGTETNANAALASMLISTGAVGGAFTIDVNASIATANTYYFSGNDHYYQYVPSPAVSWTTSVAGAATRTLNGATGYLATITDARENAFTANNVNAASFWIGASDQGTEGTWQWMTGPEAGVTFWAGTSSGSTTPPFSYASWAPGQPSDATVSLDYAATNWQGTLGLWHALDNTPTPSASGYLVEFSAPSGGFTGVNTIVTSASVDAPGPPTVPARVSDSVDEAPAPWLQSYGRLQDAACRPGWHPSWAEWAVSQTGGWVCNRTVYWNGSAWWQNPYWVWGPATTADSAPWDGT